MAAEPLQGAAGEAPPPPPPPPPAAPAPAPAPATATEHHQHKPRHGTPLLDGSHRQLAAAFDHPLSLASLTVHADDYINSSQAVAPPMHVSTTFRYSRDPEQLGPWNNLDPHAPHDSHIYSRQSAPNTTRLEAILTSVLGGPAVTYASGLAAFYAMLVFLNPKRIAIGAGYHGCDGIVRIFHRLTGLQRLELESEADLALLQEGDVVHVETPLNPTGEARSLDRYAVVARARGAWLTCDATFAPPPLQAPFAHGVDIIMHSGTKYFGGHSDMLCGVLAVNPKRIREDPSVLLRLLEDRLLLGSVMGSLEGWLGVRSLRTLELRVERQAQSAQKLVDWLAGEVGSQTSTAGELVAEVRHASLQPEAKDENSWLRKQMPRGFGPVFSIYLRSEAEAKRLPSKLHLFHHATSLGGVESLIEWRAMTDRGVDRRLLRISVGVEGWENLKADLQQGLEALAAESG